MASETAVVESLVQEHLTLVAHVVADVMVRVPRHVSRDELTSAALYGLAQAARSFDPDRGASFEGYARRRMQGSLLDELRSRDWASRGVRAQARKIRAVNDQLTASLGRTPTAAETGAAAGLSEAEVERLTGDVHRATVLNYDSIIRDSEDSEVLTMAGAGMGTGSSVWGSDPGDVLMGRERAAYLRDAVEALPERLRTVIVGGFFEERPMVELATEFGVTESRISQIKAEALALLREGMEATLDVDDDAAPVAAPATVPVGRVARRKAAYFAAVAAGSSYRDRLASDPSRRPVAADQAVSA
jgi:RNA polymerase sigma factor for flagellar operon FliA